MTFSLVARCSESGMFGTAISSSSPAVAARCSFARAGVGAVSTQNVTDPALGPMALNLMESGRSAKEAISEIQNSQNFMDFRQLLAVDGKGDTAIHSGSNVLGIWSEAMDENVASGGNLLENDGVPQAIVEHFSNSSGHLGDRLIEALRAGLMAGGEAGPVHSAGLKIVDSLSWPIADLRCDWTESCPIEEVLRIWTIYKPQVDAYVTRALDPNSAPSYGVPGDM